MYKVRKMDKNVTGFRVRESYLPTFLLHYFPSSHFPGLPIPALRSGLGNPFLLHYFHYFHHYTTSLPSHFPGLPIPALRSGLGNPSLLHYFHYFTTSHRPPSQACQSLHFVPGLGILHYFTTSPLHYYTLYCFPTVPLSRLANPYAPLRAWESFPTSPLYYYTTSPHPHYTASLPSHFPGLPIPALRSGLGNPSPLHHYTTTLLHHTPTSPLH